MKKLSHSKTIFSSCPSCNGSLGIIPEHAVLVRCKFCDELWEIAGFFEGDQLDVRPAQREKDSGLGASRNTGRINILSKKEGGTRNPKLSPKMPQKKGALDGNVQKKAPGRRRQDK